MRPAVALERQRPGQPRQNLHQRLDGRLHVLAKIEKGSRRCHIYSKNKLRKETVWYCKNCAEAPFLHPDLSFKANYTKVEYV